jgi:hypothetical protein
MRLWNRESVPVLPPPGRDLRLDLFRGIANWQIFLNHIPNNAVNWITTEYYGFSDAADLFVFISGYTAAFVYTRVMLGRGTLPASTRILGRAWQIYITQVMLFCVYAAGIGYLAMRYHDPNLENVYNIHLFFEHPERMLGAALTLRYKPLNMDILPVYILLMLVCPIMLWGLVLAPGLVMVASALLYFVARHFDLNLPSYPRGVWYFNPFCWQLYFVSGAWFAAGGRIRSTPLISSRVLVPLASAYLIFALVMTLAGRFPELRIVFPNWLYDAFNPNDKTNLAPYRVVHLAFIVLLVTRFLPRDLPALRWRIFRPVILCGQQSLAVFSTGIFLSFAAYFVLVQVTHAIWMQVLVSMAGIVLLSILAWLRTWARRIDRPAPSAAPGTPPGT